MSEQAIEKEIQDKGLTAPRITPADINDQIVRAQYHRFEGTTTIVACLTLKNGFTVVGESACASVENFDQGLGERIAFEKARDKIWAFEGYALRNKLCART